MCLSKFPVPGALQAWLYLALLSLQCRYRYSVHLHRRNGSSMQRSDFPQMTRLGQSSGRNTRSAFSTLEVTIVSF